MGFELLLPFDTDDPEFVRGFEAGRMWERIKNDRTSWNQVIHATNSEMVIRMAMAEDREFRAEIMPDNDWIDVYIT